MVRMSTVSAKEAEEKENSLKKLHETKERGIMSIEDHFLRESFQEELLEKFFSVDRLIREDKVDDLLRYVYDTDNPIANLSGDPVLHVVIACGKSNLACVLIEKMPMERLAFIKNKITGDTALHVAASKGNEMVAMKLLETDHRLLQMRNKRKEMPLHKACFYGQRRMFHLLVDNCYVDKIDILLQRTQDGSTVLHCAILGNAPDLSLYIAMQYPMLTETRNREGDTPLQLLLAIPEVVRAKEQLKLLDLIIYKLILVDEEDKLAVKDPEDPKIESPIRKICVRKSNIGYKYEESIQVDQRRSHARDKLPRNYAVLGDIFDIVISIWKGICRILRARCSKIEYLCSLKEKHNGYMKLIAFIARKPSYWEFLKLGWWRIEETDKVPSKNFWNESPLTRGIKMGIYEFVEQILKVCPASSFVLDQDNHNILQVAIEKGQERIVDLIESLAHADNPVLPSSWLSSVVKRDGSNMGHFAANPTVDEKYASPLQLQTELRWFKRVQRMVPPELRYRRNNDKKTARELFSEKHKGMLVKAQMDLKKRGELCTPLVAAVVFASSFSIPGDKEKGRPLYMEKVAFKVFSHAYVIGLSCASTALVLCLSFATSQYREEDFESYIPTKYRLAALSFIMTLVALLVAFSCNIYLNLYGAEKVETGNAIPFVCELLVLPTVFLLYLINRGGTASLGITKYLRELF